MRIINRADARRFIRKQRKFIFPKGESSATAALRRLVFSNPSEAVLAISDEESVCENKDFFSVSEIKKQKGGGAEIKFLNKLDAIKLLYEIEENERKSKGAENFFSALSKGVSGSEKGESDEI